MRCKHCNARLADHDVWCVECGKQSTLPDRELSALASLKETWQVFRKVKAQSVPSGAFAIFLGIIPVLLLTWLFSGYVKLPTETGLHVIVSYMIKALCYSIFIPFVIVGLERISDRSVYRLDHLDYLRALSTYPKYFLFCLLTNLFLVIFHIICFGLPKFGSDPILRLVWVVLINYWAAIILPAVALISIRKVSPLKSIILSYRHFHDVRWNIYLLVLFLAVLNGLATSLALIGLVITLPFSWFAIRDYTSKLVEYELLDYRR